MTKKVFLTIPVVLLILVVGGYFYINYRVQSLVDERIAGFIAGGEYQSLDYESMALTPGGDIILENLHVIDDAGNDYILEHIRISDFDYFNETPRHLLLTARGMRFPSGLPSFGDSLNAKWRGYLESAMQDDRLPVEISYRYAFQPEDAYRIDSHINISLPDSFQLSSASTIHNLVPENINRHGASPMPTPDPYTALFSNADIPSATLAFRDMGLVADMLAIHGRDFGLDGEQYRQQLLAQLQTMVLFTPRQLQDMAQEYLGRLAEFLQGEKTLQISIQPEYGGNLQQLQGEILGAFYIGNFSRIRDLLHLEVETLP